uniref:Reverse transcriptase Ty1/copia-type domain-containing protein n=1 Tax=Tanacetum cinerariifolium TaxID=118510 RepID=A0A6L2NY40_TANCI|nr:hypothetical protein [Tanacetum cinerariifolium]
MQDELNLFKRLDVWELVPLPKGRHTINVKWLWKNKTKVKNMVIQNKSRLVAKGYCQQEGIDLEESFAPVAKGFLSQPDGFVDSDFSNRLYRLKKALYGLKQAPRAWYDKLSSFLIEHHFTKDNFKMSMMGEMKFFLRLHIHQSPRGIFINQSQYTMKLLRKHEMKKCDTVMTPMAIAKTDADLLGLQFLGDKLVSWSSKNQDCTAMSTMEAEYISLSACCAQVIWMQTQLLDYGYRYNKITMYCDSKSAIAISCNPAKHINIRYHFIKEYVEQGTIELYIVGTEYQLADLFTKALPRKKFEYLVHMIGIRCMTPIRLERLARESKNYVKKEQAAQEKEEPPENSNFRQLIGENFRVIHKMSPISNTSQISLVIAIIPILPTEEPDNSLSIGDEHLSTILEMKSDEVIKSSDKNLVPIPSEFEVTSKNKSECDVPVNDQFSQIFMTFSNILFAGNDDFTSSDDESLSSEDVPIENFKIYLNSLFNDEESISTKIDPHYFNVESNLIESLLNRDTLIDFSPKFDFLLKEFSGELAHIDLILSGIEEADFDLEEEIHLVENLFDSQMEEIILFLDTNNLMLPGIENDDYDSEGDIHFLEELLRNDFLPIPKNESSNFYYHDHPLFPRPPPEPSDVKILYDLEPDTGVLAAKAVEDIYVPMSKVLPTQPTLCPNIDPLLSFSSENKDKVFKPAGFENCPPMLNKENYVSWSSRLLRYDKSRPNGKLIHNSIINGPYIRRMIPEPGDPNHEVPLNETFHVQTDDELTEKELKQIKANDQAIQTILLGLPEDIYAVVDSCETAREIWLRVQQMMKGSDIGIQEKKAKLFNEWKRFTSNDRESIESYYHRFLKLMNDLKRTKHFPEKIASNLKFLNNLQPEWSRHVTIVHQTKDLHTTDYTQLYDFLKYNQKEVDDLKAERLIRTQDPLALMATSNNPYTFPVLHQDQPLFNQNYMQQPMPNPEDITDPTTAMNMALTLMAKAFKLNYSTPINNNQRISSNPRNRQIAQPGMNMGQDRQMQMVGGSGGNQFRQYAGQNNVGKQNGIIGVPGNANQNPNGNGNLVAARAKGNATGHNRNQIRCYNCRGVGHFARKFTVRPRRRDASYLQTQLLIAQKKEAGIQLQAKEFDLMAAAVDLDEIEEVNAN